MGTVAAILDQALRRLDESSTAAPTRWARAELLDYLNEGVTELNLISSHSQATQAVALNSTDNVYALGATAIAPLSAHVSNKSLIRESISDLDSEADWEQPDEVASRPRVWSPLGLTKIIVFPRPTTVAGQALSMVVLSQPAAYTDSATEVDFPDTYDQALEDYVVSRAMFREGGKEFEQGLLPYARFFDVAQQLAGRNLFHRDPGWAVAPKTEMSATTPRLMNETVKQ